MCVIEVFNVSIAHSCRLKLPERKENDPDVS